MNKLKAAIISIISLVIVVLIVLLVLLVYYVKSSWIITIIGVAIGCIDIGFGVYIMNSKRQTYTKACWLFCIVMFPLLGCLFFTVFGTFPMNRNDWKQQNLANSKFNHFEKYDYTKEYFKKIGNDANIFAYSYKNELKPIYKNNFIRPIMDNSQTLNEIITLIRRAKKFIHIETFILHDGFFLRTIMAELVKKAQEGIEIRLLYDWMGCFRKFKKTQIKELRRYGAEVGIFNPPGINVFKGATNYRLHRKAIIVDNKYAIYGGSNFGDEYLAMDRKTNYWKDQNFFIEGEIVNSLNIAFIGDWTNFTDYTVSKKQRNLLLNNLDKYLSIHKTASSCYMQFCTSAPNYQEKGIMNLIVLLVLKAKKSIKIVTPYFIPTEFSDSILNIAARSGIDIQVILPGKSDNKKFTVLMNRGRYTELLKMNYKIYEYDGFIHSKYLIIDDQYVFITTANFDYRSFWNNFESGILIENSQFVKQMLNIFEHDLKNSIRITETMNKKFISFINKCKLAIYNLYKPLL
ncbi:MAG: cardiolipin synthase [Mycoplasmataceae bacterium]|nr:cardiolipin synthase [Mycoplasmataceae bacterium]